MEMYNTTENYTTPEGSTNFTTYSVRMRTFELYAFSINFLVGLPTHSYVIWLIVKGTGTGVASGFFNLNLSVCELGSCLNSLLFVLFEWYPFMIILALGTQGFGITGRPLFQCLMCVERYLAVVHPVTFLKFKPLRYRVICCTAAWIITLGSCLCNLMILFSDNIILHAWFFSLQFIIFFSIQLFCLSAVLRALKQSGPGERGRERQEENHMKRRAFHLILITTLNVVIIYVPMTISGFCTIMTNQYITAIWFPALLLFFLAGFVQPVLYLHRAGKLSCLCS